MPPPLPDDSTHLIDPVSELEPKRNPRTNAATGASAAGVRALSAQFVSFYFRAPVKAFFRTRVEYDSRIGLFKATLIDMLIQLHGITSAFEKQSASIHLLSLIIIGFCKSS